MTGVESLRHQARVTREIVRLNTDGVSHEASLTQPQPAGNCLNWVLGHLVAIYNQALPMLGQQPVLPSDAVARYRRGSAPITQPADARPLEDLLDAWNEACVRIDSALAALPPERLAERVAGSPTGDPNETMGTLLSTLLFHQAYHAGQLGVLRRISGKAGAIP